MSIFTRFPKERKEKWKKKTLSNCSTQEESTHENDVIMDLDGLSSKGNLSKKTHNKTYPKLSSVYLCA